MNSKRKNLALSVISLRILTLVLAVSIFAEKPHEGHLPERNSRGITALIVPFGISSGLFARTPPAAVPAGIYTDWNQNSEDKLIHPIPRCTPEMTMRSGSSM